MSQNIWDTINPSTTSGNQLATLLNDFKDAEVSGRSGPTRPSALQPGGGWIDDSQEISNSLWFYKVYLGGTSDVTVFTINLSTGNIILSGSEDIFSIARTSEDNVGPVLNFQKKRTAGNGQTLENDNLGTVQIKGVDDSGVEQVIATIETYADEDTTSSTKGSRIVIKTAANGTASQQERFVIRDGKVGIGVTDPTVELEAANESRTRKASEDAVGGRIVVKKQRIANNGQTVDGDSIGSYDFVGVDQNGAEVTMASIEVSADETTTDAVAGSILSIKSIAEGSNTLTEMIKIEKGVVTVMGQAQNLNSNIKQALAGGAGNSLFAIDSAAYGAFEASILIAALDGTDGKMGQKINVSAVWDSASSTWMYADDSTVLFGPKRAADLDYTDAGGVLTIDYDNGMTNFTSGTIYTQIRRQEA